MRVQASLPVGTVIRGQYIVECLLGRGSSGATYLVRDQPARDAPSTLFVLKEMVEANKQARHRLVSAGTSLRRLHHPGLPRVHQVVNDDKNSRVNLLLEYIAGQDLETLRQYQHEKLFSWTEVIHIMAPIIAAVTYLHRHQPPIMHGDIKPANIIMTKEDSGAVLVDFGMMKTYNPGSTTAASQYCYRAPEQYNGSIDVRTDIYALGATCYTLVTGKLPPVAHARLTQVGNAAMDPLESVNSIMPAIPMRIWKAIVQAMSLDAQRRFSSVEEFWEALWLLVTEHPAPVFAIPSVPKDPSAVPAPERAVGQAIEKPMSEPMLVESVLESIEEREDLDAEKPPPGVPVPHSVEEQEDPDATVRLPKLPPGVPADVKDQEDLNVVKLLPKQPGDRRAPGSLRKMGVLFILVALLISLGIGASFLSRARGHPTATSATPPSQAASPAPTPTSAPATSSYPTLAGTYAGTMYDLQLNASTSMSLTGIKQYQGSFTGYLRLGPNMVDSGLFSGTIDSTKHLRFTVTGVAGNTTLFFEGAMQSAISLSGEYYQCSPGPIQEGKCSQAPGSYGIWSVVRA